MSDNNVKLGSPPSADARRDAVHVAIIPIVASQRLAPGTPVNMNTDKQAYTVPRDYMLGVTDPFGPIVEEGELVWLLLKPGTITGLRHHWEHPTFPDETEKPAVEAGTIAKAISRAWLLGWCRRLWPYDGDVPENSLKYLLQGIQEGSVCFGITGYSEGMHYNKDTQEYELPEEFWHHYKGYTGRDKPGKTINFRCAC